MPAAAGLVVLPRAAWCLACGSASNRDPLVPPVVPAGYSHWVHAGCKELQLLQPLRM